MSFVIISFMNLASFEACPGFAVNMSRTISMTRPHRNATRPARAPPRRAAPPTDTRLLRAAGAGVTLARADPHAPPLRALDTAEIHPGHGPRAFGDLVVGRLLEAEHRRE